MTNPQQVREIQGSDIAQTVGRAIPAPEIDLTPQEMIRRATAELHTHENVSH